MCDKKKRDRNPYHRDHDGSGLTAALRIADATWSPNTNVLQKILLEQLWLLQEFDNIPSHDVDQLKDLKLKVANWICGEGDWRIAFDPPLTEHLGQNREP